MAFLVVLEGIDGSGKGTQSRFLLQSLQMAGFRAALLSFPRYDDTFFGARIGDFLNGRFGSLAEVHPFLASLLYAGDRAESRAVIQQQLATHDVLICDRYVPSNLAHQGVKAAPADRARLWDWISHVEYELHQLPRPDLVVFLDVPVETAVELIARKAQRTYTEQAADLQEADTRYLHSVHDCYTQLAANQTGWKTIPCVIDGGLRSTEDVALELERLVTDRLRQRQLRQFSHNVEPSVVAATALVEGAIGTGFDDLVTSRKDWLQEVLRPWCQRATRKDLLQAERDWPDIAGRVAPEKTLWSWAWSRFPELVQPALGIDETYAVTVTLRDGRELHGYPDARRSQRGELWLIGTVTTTDSDSTPIGPLSLDEIGSVIRQ